LIYERVYLVFLSTKLSGLTDEYYGIKLSGCKILMCFFAYFAHNQVNQTQFSNEQLRILLKNMVTASTYTICEVGKNLSAVKRELKATISPINERIDQLKIPKDVIVRKEHHIRIDFRNSKAVITIISMALAILLLLGGNVWQLNTNGKLRDNDLKYRYIKLKGEVDTKVLSQLESIFTYNRDRDAISKIRKQVKSHEQLVREHAEKLERERFEEVQN